MKKLIQLAVIGVVAAVATLPAEAMSGLFIKRTPIIIRESVTNYFTRVQTNSFTNVVTVTNEVVVTKTNEATGAVVTVVQPTVEVKPTVFTTLTTNFETLVVPPVFYNTLAWSDTGKQAIDGVGLAASATGMPGAGLVAPLVTALGGLVFGFMNRRGKKKAEAQLAGSVEAHSATSDALLIARDAAGTLVENFEELRKVALAIPGYTKDVDAKVMQAVQFAQLAAGPEVKQLIQTHVDEKTEKTTAGSGN